MKKFLLFLVAIVVVGALVTGFDSPETGSSSGSWQTTGYDNNSSGGYFPGTATNNNSIFNFDTHITCSICGGTGKRTCISCHGTGHLSKTHYTPNYGYGSSTYQTYSKCYACNSTGKAMCTGCYGKGYI